MVRCYIVVKLMLRKVGCTRVEGGVIGIVDKGMEDGFDGEESMKAGDDVTKDGLVSEVGLEEKEVRDEVRNKDDVVKGVVPEIPPPVELNPILNPNVNCWIAICGEILLGNLVGIVGENSSFKKLFHLVSCVRYLRLTKPEPARIPLWVKIYNVPLEAWNVEGISRIASRIGTPIIMDKVTTSMCKRGYGRASFARVLIEVDATEGIVDNVEIWYQKLNRTMKLRVEYAWQPPFNESNEEQKGNNGLQSVPSRKFTRPGVDPTGSQFQQQSANGLRYGRGAEENVVAEMENSGSFRNQAFDFVYTEAYSKESDRIEKLILKKQLAGGGLYMTNFLPYVTSDHCPALLVIPCSATKRKRSFRFMNYLIDKKEFHQVVKDNWNVPVYGFAIDELKKVQNELDKDPQNVKLKEGRLSRNTIISVEDDVGIVFYNDDVAPIFVDHFESFFGTCEKTFPVEDPDGLFIKKIDVVSALYMVRDVSNDEIKAALFDIDEIRHPDLMIVRDDCTILLDKVKKRVEDWRNKSLSFPGRLQLIAYALSSLNVFWASMFILPQGKSKGSLGLKSIHVWNEALMAKHLWNVDTRFKDVLDIPVPTLSENNDEKVIWINKKGKEKNFNVNEVWKDLKANPPKERNIRLFGDAGRYNEVIFKLVVKAVRLRVMGLKLKVTNEVIKASEDCERLAFQYPGAHERLVELKGPLFLCFFRPAVCSNLYDLFLGFLSQGEESPWVYDKDNVTGTTDSYCRIMDDMQIHKTIIQDSTYWSYTLFPCSRLAYGDGSKDVDWSQHFLMIQSLLSSSIRISGFPNEAEDCEALVIEGQIPRAREASKIRDILDNTAQNTKHGKGNLNDQIIIPVSDSSQHCAVCGTPVDGPYCHGLFRGKEIDEEYERDCEIRIRKLKQDFNIWGSEVLKKKGEKLTKMKSILLPVVTCFLSTCDDEDDFSFQEILLLEYSTSQSHPIPIEIDPILEEFADELAHIAPIPPGIVEADFDPNDDISNYDVDFYDCVDIEEDGGEIDLDISKIVDISLREKLVESYLLIEKINILSLSPPIPISPIFCPSSTIPVVDLDLPLEEADVPSFSDNSILRGIESDRDSGEDTTSIEILPL
ncbi:zinc knuckle CX2CX4HX4C containing protein [Tanacetum coccineum]|uniref:Zinc knuckle CX2CX4HX4C containing protein n=1 Tax=Tanacetum coccineum TaxID=301880 RepID=A0ABQ5DLK9_9ASTR